LLGLALNWGPLIAAVFLFQAWQASPQDRTAGIPLTTY